MRTGYFGRHSTENQSTIRTNVHLVNSYGNGFCGYNPHKTMSFHWCSMNIHLPYVTCATRRKKYIKRFKSVYCR